LKDKTTHKEMTFTSMRMNRTTLSAITFGCYLNVLPGMHTKRTSHGNNFFVKRL